jgi:ABC-2 type transport system permease protein
MLMAAIHASMLGAVIISKEERDRTSEFLYVKPVARCEVITAKIGAAATCVVVLNAVTTASSLMFINLYGKGENVAGGVVLLMIGMLLVQFVFLFMGMAAAALLKRPKASTGIAAGVMLAAFFLSVAIDVSGKINFLIGFTPFKYFDAKYLLYGGSVEIWYVLLSVALTAGFIAATYWFFKRRDLKV